MDEAPASPARSATPNARGATSTARSVAPNAGAPAAIVRKPAARPAAADADEIPVIRPARDAGNARVSARRIMYSLPEQIAEAVSERILSGEYPPGARITEQAVSDEFGVSRGPIREALRLVEKDGLVTILPRRGAQVTNLSIEEVREIFDIRASLNGLRDRLIAESVARSELVPLLEVEVAQLARWARDAAKAEEYLETVFRLNRLLNRATPSKRLSAYLTSLEMQTVRYTRLGLATPERRRQSVKSWRDWVEALRKGRGADAERIARARVIESRDAAIRALERARPDQS
jgi:DNA-binding GntR family transcriptional regulator